MSSPEVVIDKYYLANWESKGDMLSEQQYRTGEF
jgi:hypothetical protein